MRVAGGSAHNGVERAPLVEHPLDVIMEGL